MNPHDTLLLFDIDGTLLRSSRLHSTILVSAVEHIYGTKISHLTLVTKGKTDTQIAMEYLDLAGVSVEEFEQKREEYVQHAANLFLAAVTATDIEVIDGVRECLELVTELGYRVGLLTGNIEAIAWKKMDLGGLRQYFSLGGFGSESTQRYRLVEFAERRFEKLYGDRPKRRVLIGDTPRDVAAALESGSDIVGVATGHFSSADLHAAGASTVIPNLRKLVDVL